ncbi:hypothetical protein GXW74_18690 [Roseomonas eburnea]|uniref:Uncharacterized protein n=1 Tax=Neoroseomonas eburnea TaxID=1346889 RepID=A0A9X9XFP0_9PROT|nr:hypothetical protein [Neoroseomonas eburnea]MBR0682526.1 hypothetical protein [Neoroseomonas eburnea]
MVASVLLLLSGQDTAAREQFRHFGEIHVRAARLATLAPLCGLRDAGWADRLQRGVSATRHDVLPEGQREGLVSAAFAMTLGTRLFETYGMAICREAEDTMRWRDADDLARMEAGDEPRLPALPDAVEALGWQAFVATIALRCDDRDRRWASAAFAGLQRAIAMEPGLGDDQAARRGMARHLVMTARGMANHVHATPGLRPCRALWHSGARAALAASDEAASDWRRLCTGRGPHASCRAGEDRS